MTARASADSLRLSIVLATDTYETLRPEIVIIAPGESLVRIDSSQLDGFGAVRIVAVSTPLSLPRARAAGLWRARSNIRFGAPGQRLPLGTTLGISVGALTKAIGEALGYLGLTASQAESGLTDNELHQLRHASFPAHD